MPNSLLARFSWTLVATVGLAVLLVVLAVLQYRWVAQFTAADRERQQTLLASRAEQVALDIDREVTRAFVWLQADPPFVLDRDELDRLRERAARWFHAAPYPQLVSEIYRVQLGPDGGSVLERFDREASAFAPASWTPPLEAWRDEVRRQTAKVRGQDADHGPHFGAVVDARLGAIVIPRRVLRRVGGTSFAVSPELRFTIVLLDTAFLKDDFIPSLWKKYFPPSEQVLYSMAVVRAADGHTLLASEETDPGETRRHADVTMPLMRLRPNEFNRFFVEARQMDGPRPPPDGSGAARESPPPGEPGGRSESRISVSVLTGDGQRRAAERVFTMRRSSDPAWTLFIRHRAGSLEAAAGRTRRWNLGMSFGMLVLLAASFGLVVASARRSERLARQQMEFVAGVSHELRTPLAVIRSAAENLADGVVNDPPQVKRYGAVIAGEGRRLTDMVEQVMEYARFDAGRRAPAVEPVVPSAIVQGAVDALAPWLREHGVVVECRIEDGLPAVDGDAGALTRAVQNLVSNAAKYGDGQWVGVMARAARGRRGREVHVAVSDRGDGLSEGEHERIFEPFERGRRAIESQIPGAGLGLSLVRRTAEEHGGRVTVARTGDTTVFTLVLPASARPAGEPAPALAPHAPRT